MPKTIICKVCSKPFEWSDGEIEFYRDRNLADPRRCPDCRTKRKSDKEIIARLENRIKELGG